MLKKTPMTSRQSRQYFCSQKDFIFSYVKAANIVCRQSRKAQTPHCLLWESRYWPRKWTTLSPFLSNLMLRHLDACVGIGFV